MGKNLSVREYFDSDEYRWEDKYVRSDMEAQMYCDRQDDCLRLVKKFVNPGGRILEVGCGTGVLSQQLDRTGFAITSSDFSIRMLRETRKRTGLTRLILADVSNLPFKTESFDAIVLIGVMAYIERPNDILEGLKPLLKPGGCLVVSSANKRMLFGVISRLINTPLYWLGASRPAKDPDRQFFAQNNIYYRTSAFNSMVENCGYELEANFNVGFGRIRVLKKNLFPDSFNVALSRLISMISRHWTFRWLQDFAFNNIACFRAVSIQKTNE